MKKNISVSLDIEVINALSKMKKYSKFVNDVVREKLIQENLLNPKITYIVFIISKETGEIKKRKIIASNEIEVYSQYFNQEFNSLHKAKEYAGLQGKILNIYRLDTSEE